MFSMWLVQSVCDCASGSVSDSDWDSDFGGTFIFGFVFMSMSVRVYVCVVIRVTHCDMGRAPLFNLHSDRFDSSSCLQ